MKLYTENGYLNTAAILDSPYTFVFVVGGRAIGKTYGTLKELLDRGTKFLYMRRTQAQADLISKPEMSPFKTINRDTGRDITIKPLTKYNGGIYDGDSLIGYTVALSTMSNMRGFDASDVDVMVYDEFIPEKHERPIKNEAAAYLNAYETVNRNRELQGRAALKSICLANANDLGNALFLELGLVQRAERMRKRGQDVYTDSKRGIMLVLPHESPISAQKRNTSLYRRTEGGEFSAMALDNDFSSESYSKTGSRPLIEYRPVCGIGELTVYRHKSGNGYYISAHRTGSPPCWDTDSASRRRFWRANGWLWEAYLENHVEFESHLCEILLTRYAT